MAWGFLDGSNEQDSYNDVDGYFNPQPPLAVLTPQQVILGGIPANTNPNRWQPLSLDVAFDQNGNPLPGGVQPYNGVSWLHTQAFSLYREHDRALWIEPGPTVKTRHRNGCLLQAGGEDVLLKHAQLSDETVIDISPAQRGTTPWEPTTVTGAR